MAQCSIASVVVTVDYDVNHAGFDCIHQTVLDQPYSLDEKCVEIFHWRHGTYLDDEGELRIDEAIVETCVRATLKDPARRADILRKMMRLRDPSDVYAQGDALTARASSRAAYARAQLTLSCHSIRLGWREYVRHPVRA